MYSRRSRRLQRRQVQATNWLVSWQWCSCVAFSPHGQWSHLGFSRVRRARTARSSLLHQPATDACQAEAAVFMPREVLQGAGPGLKAEPAPPQLGLVQEIHVSLNAALVLHYI